MSKKINLVIEQGATFKNDFEILDDNGNLMDLSGYSANAYMKKHYESNTSTLFTCDVLNTGTITLSMNATTTASLSPQRYVYTLEISKNSDVLRILEGLITVSPD